MTEERLVLQLPEERVVTEKAETFYEKLKGLRFRSSGKMFFDLGKVARTMVDTVFVYDDLYLYFLDEDMTVVERKCLPPNRFYTPETGYRFLLESFEDLNLEEGDEVNVELPGLSGFAVAQHG
ncbi:DUF192 domain-containing protein [Haloarcula vallismortis]|uniref:hypothetical protein n=1 Tax=Haloarcula vallismortis TaxID=28442 RepID=UPI00111409BD|nr:hypothetical protein [Haloarcula vallismortis]